MSHKEYEKFAEMLRRHGSILSVAATERLASDMARIFIEDNPAFDTQRFFRACGIGP